MANRLDTFVPFLLTKVQLARARGIHRFRLTHANGDELQVRLSGQLWDQIEVVRVPKVEIPNPLVTGWSEAARPRMRLATSVAQLKRDVEEGITSYQAEAWRG